MDIEHTRCLCRPAWLVCWSIAVLCMPKPIMTCLILSCSLLAVVQECILMHLIGVEPQQLNALTLANALWPHTPANSKRLVKCKVRGL